ncbi:MAG: LPS assembly protein LptD, partial [Pseudobdellovibrionaceae bacterium]
NRWFLHYDHVHLLPEGYTHRAKLNLASDLQYAKDFPLEAQNNGDSAMENRMSVTKNGYDYHFSADSSFYINMLKSDPLASRDDSVHRLPELRFATVPKPLLNTGLQYSVDFDYTNFTRSSASYDSLVQRTNLDTGKTLNFDQSSGSTSGGPYYRYPRSNCSKTLKNGTSILDPQYDSKPNCTLDPDNDYNADKDLIRTGQRLELIPSLYKSFVVADGVDLTSKVSYRESHYIFNIGDEKYNVRRYVRLENSGSGYFSQVYGNRDNPKASLYKHEIIPQITYTAIPWLAQKKHPFFGYGQQSESPYYSSSNLSDADLGNDFSIQFDYNDRIYDRELVTFSVTQNLIYKQWSDNKSTYSPLASLKISQSYDAYQDKLDTKDKQPWSNLGIEISASIDRYAAASSFNYFPYQNVTNVSSRIRVNGDGGLFGQLGLIKQYSITPGQPVAGGVSTEDYTFLGGFRSRPVNFLGKVVYDNIRPKKTPDESLTPIEKIKSWSYIAQIKPPGDCWVITFTQLQMIGGESTFKINLEFTWDGVKKASIASNALDVIGF